MKQQNKMKMRVVMVNIRNGSNVRLKTNDSLSLDTIFFIVLKPKRNGIGHHLIRLCAYIVRIFFGSIGNREEMSVI